MNSTIKGASGNLSGLQEKEVLITIRGTAQVEDIVTDLTALPVVRIPPPPLPSLFRSVHHPGQATADSGDSP